MHIDAAIKVIMTCNECVAMLPLRLECLVGARLEHWRNVPSHTAGICEVRINQHARLDGGAVSTFSLNKHLSEPFASLCKFYLIVGRSSFL